MTLKRLGWKEWVFFSNFFPKAIRAKIDSGAKTSSLDADDIELESDNLIGFSLSLDKNVKIRCHAPLVGKRKVKSSTGISRTRFVIRTKIKIAGTELEGEFTLNLRKSMKFKVLIGRNILKDNFLVDVSEKYLGRKNKKV